MSEEKITDAELQELRIEIANEFAERITNNSPVNKISESAQEKYYLHLGIALDVAHIAIWKIFRQERFDICKRK